MTTLLGVDIVGRRVLVAGGGPVAAAKARALAEDGAAVEIVAPAVCEDLASLVTAGAVRWSRREVRIDDVNEAWLVIAATGDTQVDRQLCERATAARIFSVCAGASQHGTARNPAVTDHAGLRVGVVSEDTPDPARVVRVRNALADHLRTAPLDLRAARRIPGRFGRVLLVGGGPGAEDLITIRGRQALSEADVIVTDRLGPRTLLQSLPADVEVIDVGKTPGHHHWTQDRINALLVEQAERGRVVVRLKGGDPYVFGRGGEEERYCREHGMPVEVIPGVSSVIAAPAAAGVPLTHRGTIAAVHVVHGHGPLAASAVLAVVRREATLVILMGVSKLAEHVRTLLDAHAEPTLPTALIEDATLPTQRVTRAPLDRLIETAERAGVRAPAVIVIGDVTAPELLSAVAVRGAEGAA